MKKKISILALVLFGFSLAPFQKVIGQDAGDAAALAGVGIAIYKEIDGNCDDKREAGTLQTRCKDGVCQTVSCISFRSACDSNISNACE